MYHIFFIHSSVDGHLGCFHVLAIVNRAAVNIGVHVSFRIVVFSGYMPSCGSAVLLWRTIWRFFKKLKIGTSLVAQWLRIRLPMQGTWVRALVWEDPTCHGATKPMHYQLPSLRSRAREPQLLDPCATTTEVRVPRTRAPQQEKPPQREACTPQRRVAPARCN